jgi:kinesin family protein C1
VAALEAEKASSSALSGRTQAQAALNAALQEQAAALREGRAAAEASAELRAGEARALGARVAELEVLLEEATRRAREGEAVRRRLHNTILELKGNVRVFCRVRPPAPGAASAVGVPTEGETAGRGVELTQQSGPSAAAGGKAAQQQQRHAFAFDRVFGPGAGQAEVFEEVSALVQSALDGYAVCIFAYGQTAAGKTHTMLGSPGAEGVIPRAVRQVFDAAAAGAAQGWAYVMSAAMLEIYNEEIRDLLGPGPPPGKKHQVSRDERGATSVSHLEWADVRRTEGVAALLGRAMRARAVGATALNDASSRSHMVFMLRIEGANAATGQTLRGALNLVDLAGSERVGRSGAEGQALKEAQAINKSLSALGDVIAALGAREAHVPYRNSKLTHLLQGSLGGAGKALMLCNVSSDPASAAETLCTLRFAAKVNATEIGTARRNVAAAAAAEGRPAAAK